MALGIVKYFYNRSFHSICVIWFAVSLSWSVFVDLKFKLSCVTTKCDDDSDKHFVKVPYVGAASKRFVKQLSELVKCKFGVEICTIYTTYKVGRYFQLKSATPITLSSNVVYQFLCSCDTNLSYVGMSSRHLGTRAREHLILADINTKSAI